MSDSIELAPSRRFDKHPLIAQALAALQNREETPTMRASAHIASRIYYPAFLSPLPAKGFFAPTPYEKAVDALNAILDDLL